MQILFSRIVAGAGTSLNIVQLIARLHIFLIYYSVKNKGMWRCMYVAFSSVMNNDGKKSEFGKIKSLEVEFPPSLDDGCSQFVIKKYPLLFGACITCFYFPQIKQVTIMQQTSLNKEETIGTVTE